MSVTAPDDAFLDVNDAHLRVFGNVHADGLKLGQLEVVTTTSTGSTIQFLHQHTAFTTTSNIEVGTTNHDLFVDTNASRVGILTNTPTTALDVNGTVKATAFDGDGALLTGIPSSAINGTLSQWTTVTGPKIHYSDGNVGIGIADPLHTLDVVGDINFTGTLREDGNPFVSTPWTIETSPAALSYTGGNVGIGAATPSSKLEVTGNAHVTTDLSVGGTLSINTITAAATHALSAVTAVGASTGDTIQLTNATTGLVTTGNVEVGKELTVAGNVAVDTDPLFVDSVNDRVGIGTISPDARLHVEEPTDISATTKLFHTENGFSGGSVGHFEIVEKKTGAGTGWSDFTLRLQRRVDSTEQGYIEFNPTGSTGDYGIAFGSGTDEIMRIDGVNDRVGIGTAIPSSVFNTYGGSLSDGGDAYTSKVAATFQVGRGGGGQAADQGTGAILELRHESDYRHVTIESVSESTNSGDIGLRFKTTTDTNGPQERMRIDGDGNVGIGTVSPDEKLHVNGNIRLGGPQGTDEDTSYYIKSAGQIHINSAADGAADNSYICLDLRSGQSGSNRSGIGICGAATNTSYQHIAFETTDAERMRINYDGNVGIGTTSPGSTLEVHGTGIHIDGTVLRSYSSIGAVTAGTWYKLCDFSALPATVAGVCAIRIKWGGGTLTNVGTYYWSGYASGIVSYNTYGNGSGTYSAAPYEPLTLSQHYHHRAAGAFEFRLDGDGANGSYGYQSLYIKSPQALSSLSLEVIAMPLRR